jgi:hypothetical protein
MKFTEQAISETEALQPGKAEKSQQFVAEAAEAYTKA